MIRLHLVYAVPDTELRQQLIEDLVALLVLPYDAFLHRYQHSGFSNHPEKYIKYTSSMQVEDCIRSFFSGVHLE